MKKGFFRSIINWLAIAMIAMSLLIDPEFIKGLQQMGVPESAVAWGVRVIGGLIIAVRTIQHHAKISGLFGKTEDGGTQ